MPRSKLTKDDQVQHVYLGLKRGPLLHGTALVVTLSCAYVAAASILAASGIKPDWRYLCFLILLWPISVTIMRVRKEHAARLAALPVEPYSGRQTVDSHRKIDIGSLTV
jgi:hypothetical protein